MDLVWWEIVVLIAAGFGAGLVNVMAGGGSILTVPIMMFLGMPGPIANGTNRITIVAHNFSAIVTYLRYGVPHAKLCITLTLVAIPPALLGAWLSKKQCDPDNEPKNLRLGHMLMAVAGFWGGFIQIGMGFVVLPIMHRIMGLSLIDTNILKVFIIFTYTSLAMFVFAATSEVLWLVGAIAAIGNVAGGMVGARLTLSHGEQLIRQVLTIAIITMIIKLLFFS